MENGVSFDIEHGLPQVPSLIKCLSSHEVTGFGIGDTENSSSQEVSETASEGSRGDEEESVAIINHQMNHSVSIIMPLTCAEVQPQNTIRILSGGDQTETATTAPISSCQSNSEPPLPPRCSSLRDKRFDSFKTFSGKLERQFSILSGRCTAAEIEEEKDNSSSMRNTDRPLPVDRYYDALEGPELETVRASEEIVLPQDSKWPFLLRFPVSSFGICLGVSSQAILWKTLATAPSTQFLHVSLKINLVLWLFSVAIVAAIFATYLLKIILYFEAVRREYYHPIRVNFFFAPWIALLFLALGAPHSVTKHMDHELWYVLMGPLFFLELKIYGQWVSGGERRLSKVANPSNHLSVIGNFVGALLGASMGLREGPIFFFAVGLAHYLVVFVTLYQRLPTNATLPRELQPVFFLFVATPSVASVAWGRIQGSFDCASRIAYFVAMFLYFSLAVRVNFFRGFKFSLSWWAYTFPMTGAAIATIHYTNEVTNVATKALCVMLCLVSVLTVTAVLVSTILHAFVFRDLFPNDLAIAISDRKRKKPHKKWFNLRNYGSNDHSKEIKNYLKFVISDKNDLEACPTKTNPSTS